MTDLSTTYLGLNLKNPLVASASPLSKKIDKARKLEEAGISAIVMYSLFEEQIIHESLELDHYLSRGADSFPEALSYLPDGGLYAVSPEKYLNQVAGLKKTLEIPVIGSLNGVSKGGWTNYARKIEEAGADGLVLFNRFYQPDFDLEELEVVHSLDLSTSADLRLPLRWTSILYGKVNADIALTSGIHTSQDVLKAMMAGAQVAMMASALLWDGSTKRITEILDHIQTWMQEHEYQSIRQMQ